MTRGILLAGNESALSRAIETETVNRVEQFAAALIPNRLSGTFEAKGSATKATAIETATANTGYKNSSQGNNKCIFLDWNPSSPISARTLILAAENRLEHIDEAILICSPPSVRCRAADLTLSDVEIMVNDHIKGWFFLIKELAAVFTNRQRGTLVLVYNDIASSGREDAADILGPSSIASFRALTQGLLSSAHNEQYITIGFSNSDAGSEAAFAAFMYKHIEEAGKRSNGKLHKFGKFNFFK